MCIRDSVPTGIKTGVLIVPFDVLIIPALAEDDLSFDIKSNFIETNILIEKNI